MATTFDTPPDDGAAAARDPALQTRLQLLRLLKQRAMPEKTDILHLKRLIRDVAGDTEDGRETAQAFVSAYFDLYLARLSGEPALERDGLRRCLAHLAQHREGDAGAARAAGRRPNSI